jgi:hypothetical protein
LWKSVQTFTFIGSTILFHVILASVVFSALEAPQWQFLFKYNTLYVFTEICQTLHFPSAISDPTGQNFPGFKYFLLVRVVLP